MLLGAHVQGGLCFSSGMVSRTPHTFARKVSRMRSPLLFLGRAFLPAALQGAFHSCAPSSFCSFNENLHLLL